jgi:hypothetical protein
MKNIKGTAIAAGMVLGVGLGGMALGVGLAGTAHATIATIGVRGDMSAVNLTDELRYTGMHQFVFQSETLGPWICSERASGVSEDGLIHYYDGPTTPYTAEQSVVIVMGSEYHFCPEFES